MDSSVTEALRTDSMLADLIIQNSLRCFQEVGRSGSIPSGCFERILEDVLFVSLYTLL